MARILRGVKGPFAPSAGGGGLFSFPPSFGPCVGLVSPFLAYLYILFRTVVLVASFMT